MRTEVVAWASQALSWAANLLQVGSFLFVLVAYWRARSSLRRYLQALQTSISARPCALAIGLGADIEGQVRAYLEDQKLDLPVKAYTRKGYFSPSEFLPILRDLQKIKGELTEAGVTEVHLFYRGPVTMAAAVGALLDNWVPIKVYDFKEGTYHYHATLEKGLVKGLAAGDVMLEGEALLGGGSRQSKAV